MSNPFKNIHTSLPYVLLTVSLALYVFITYSFERHDAVPLTVTYVILFALYLFLLSILKKPGLIRFSTFFSLFIRLSLLFALPNLSDDFYRFVWDGRLLSHGINPFIHLPSYYIDNPAMAPEGISQDLFRKLNSPGYFTIYPPVNQLLFWLAVLISQDSILGAVIVIRVFILMAEAGNLYIIKKLLKIYKIPEENLLIYALNPLVILELSGNLHFEGVVVFFVLTGVYLLHRHKLLYAAASFALAISTKLIPLIFLPLIFSRLSLRKTVYFYLICGAFTILTFLPLLNTEFIEGVSSSLSLYFQKFEFNASLYFLLREYGYYVEGYNIIGKAGGFLAFITLVAIVHYAFYEAFTRQKTLPHTFLWALLIYLSLATTLHPWYIIPLIAYCLFTSYRFPLLWSFLIFLTYTNYHTDGFRENLHLVLAEYLILMVFLMWEWGRNYFLKTAIPEKKQL